jgi:N-acetylneuraminate synthase
MIIAEIGQAHEGSLGMAHAYIDALKDSGIHAVKFQMHIASAESSSYEPFRVAFSYEDANRFDYWKRMEFTSEQWMGLKKHCEDLGLIFICSPFSNAAVDVLEQLSVKYYKIGSGEVNNLLLLKKIANTKKPIILSSGLSTWAELDGAVNLFKTNGTELSLMQCTTAYPTLPGDWGLHLMAEMKQRFLVPVGFSDHSGDIFACLAAAALGADLFEFHVVFDKQMFGPDSKASICIQDVKRLTKGIADIQESQKHFIEKENNKKELKSMFGKSLSVNKDMKGGDRLRFEDLEAKKPAGRGIPAAAYEAFLGRTLKHDKPQWDFLYEQDFNPI